MKKIGLIRLLAMAIALSIIFAGCVCAFAEPAEIPLTGDNIIIDEGSVVYSYSGDCIYNGDVAGFVSIISRVCF